MPIFNGELNDSKILWNEAMTGFGHTSGLVDTLNRMANKIYDLLRIQMIHADGTSKIRAFNKKIADAGSVAPDGGLPPEELGFFAFTITDNKAVITGSILFNTGLGSSKGNGANLNTTYELDGVDILNDNELFYDVQANTPERSFASGFSANVIGAGLHTMSIIWHTTNNDIVNTESGVYMHGLVLENHELIEG